MKRTLISTLTLLLVCAPSCPEAGTQDQANLAFHVQSRASKSTWVCDSANPNVQGLTCVQFVSEWPILSGADVYLLVTNADYDPGIAGLSCGIQFDPGVATFGWSLCADLDFPNGSWPASGGGNRITWVASTNCQQYSPEPFIPYTVQAVTGSFYMYAYSDGQMTVTPNNGLAIPELKVADCSAAESDLSAFAIPWLSFGTNYGFNPCFPCKPNSPNCSPVEQATWGRIKVSY